MLVNSLVIPILSYTVFLKFVMFQIGKNIGTIELKFIKLDDYLEEGKSTNDERRQN